MIVFFTDGIHHHQVYWADEMYSMLGGDFVYVVLCRNKE